MRALTSLGRAQWALIAALVLSAGIGVGVASDYGTGPTTDPSAGRATLSSRATTAGPVQIEITPERLDATSAAFAVVLDNHEIDLTMNLAQGASLTVGARTWGPATWTGDGPSGHHREGTLTFPTGGPVAGQVVLTLAGFPDPVRLQWTLPEGGVRS